MSSVAALLRQDLPADVQEQQRIERRRLAEEERKKRIFDPKKRTMGLELSALDSQVRERHAQEEAARERDVEAQLQANHEAELLSILESQRARLRRDQARGVDEFRKASQSPELARDYDLSDPHAQAHAPAIRQGDNCPVSSIQQFTGEDLSSAERVKQQYEQLRVWNYMAQKEREAVKLQEREAKEEADRVLTDTDRKRVQLAQEEQRRRREEATRTAELNLRMVRGFVDSGTCTGMPNYVIPQTGRRASVARARDQDARGAAQD